LIRKLDVRAGIRQEFFKKWRERQLPNDRDEMRIREKGKSKEKGEEEVENTQKKINSIQFW